MNAPRAASLEDIITTALKALRRDPHIDPRPGDEFLKWGQHVFALPADASHALPGYVWLGTETGKIQNGVDLKQFRDWAAKDCEVIHAAE
jgi:hypothetical protein